MWVLVVVRECLFYEMILRIHFFNKLLHLVYSPPQPVIHFFYASVIVDFVCVFEGVLLRRDLLFNLFPLLPQMVKLMVQHVSLA